RGDSTNPISQVLAPKGTERWLRINETDRASIRHAAVDQTDARNAKKRTACGVSDRRALNRGAWRCARNSIRIAICPRRPLMLPERMIPLRGRSEPPTVGAGLGGGP